MITAEDRPSRPLQGQRWNRILRSLREAGGLTQDGFATWLSVGTRTVQRWEQGAAAPDLAAEAGLLAYCEATRLFRRHESGGLAGLTPSPAWLHDLIAEARQTARASRAPHPIPAAQLTPPLTALVGRNEELAAVVEAIRSCRLVTLTGTGGVGKTRLAQAAAMALLNEFPDGVAAVALAAITDPDLVLSTIF